MAIKYPKVSIIIVNYNQKQFTLDCLKSLNKLTYPDFEIIVVDNNSTDGSFGEIKKKYPKVKQIKLKKNTGFTGGNNEGFKIAKGEFVLLLNNDTKVTSNFLKPLVEDLVLDDKLGIVQSKLFVMDKPEYLDSVVSYLTTTGFLYHEGYLKKDGKRYQKFKHTFSAKGACMLIKREVLSLGLFDNDYFAYFEETDLCWRAWILGYKVGFEPRSIIFHKMGATSSKMKSAFVHYHSFKNRIRTIIKNSSATTLVWMLPLHISTCLGLAGYFLVSGQTQGSWAIIKALYWNLANLEETLKLRGRVQRKRAITDREIFALTLKNPPISFYKHHLSLVKRNLSQ